LNPTPYFHPRFVPISVEELLARISVPDPMSAPSLIKHARNLRERAFARLVFDIHEDEIRFYGPAKYPNQQPSQPFEFHPKGLTIGPYMRACRDIPCLSQLPIHCPSGTDPIMHIGLQDLANILAVEVEECVNSKYYPGIQQYNLRESHITAVMEGMQREMDREWNRQGKNRARGRLAFTDLPFYRQQALAERRRYWFSRFGITPRSWRTGTWSLWKVACIPFPEEYKGRITWSGGEDA